MLNPGGAVVVVIIWYLDL